MTANPAFGWHLTRDDLVMQHLGYAADQVRDLLPFVAGERQAEPEAVAAACTDSFVLNLRLVADFLTGGKANLDVRAVDLAPGWDMNGGLRDRLREWHTLASKHAMHMSQKRVTEDGVGDPATPADFAQMAADVAEAVDGFRIALGTPRIGSV